MKKQTKSTVKFDFQSIKTFEDACKKVGVDPKQLPTVPFEELAKPIIAAYKLMIIYKAINNGWKPDWSNWNQYKYYPWYEVLSSGFGFDHSNYTCGNSFTYVGSRLCTGTSEKALYVANQFMAEYQDLFLYSE